MNRAVFLDRDGTIAKDVPYCSRPKDFELLPGVGEGIKLLNEAGFKVIIVANQSGIAHGYFTEEMLGKIHQKMGGDLAKYEAHIDAIYYCPHHPDEGCDCRKPKPTLILRAAKEHSIDLTESFLIGDKLQDIEAGHATGCRTVLLSSTRERSAPWKHNSGPDFIAENFTQASRRVLETEDMNDLSKNNVEIGNMGKLALVIPAYNEGNRLGQTLDDYMTYFSQLPSDKFEILIVCNGCSDRTPDIAGAYSRRRPQVKVLNLPEKGKGNAIKQGLKAIAADIVGYTDADGSTKPEEIYKLMQVVHQGYDGAIGSRWLPGARLPIKQSVTRRIASRGFNVLVKLLFGLPYADTQCGAKVFKGAVIQDVIEDCKSPSFAFDVELLWKVSKKDYRIKEVPITWSNSSESKLLLHRDVLKMLREIVQLRLRS